MPVSRYTTALLKAVPGQLWLSRLLLFVLMLSLSGYAIQWTHGELFWSSKNGALIIVLLLLLALISASISLILSHRIYSQLRVIASLSGNNLLYSHLIEASPDAICCFHPEGEILTINQQFANLILESAPDSLVGKNAFDLLVPEQREEGYKIVNELMQQNISRNISMNLVRSDGSSVPLEIHAAYINHDPAHQAIICAIIRDVREKKRNEDELELANQVFQHSSDGIFITDENNHILRINKAITVITGYSEHDVLGNSPRIFSSGRQDKQFYKEMWKHIQMHGCWQGEIINRRKNGELYNQWLSISTVKDSDGHIKNHIAVISDITERKAASEHVRWLAYHDSLTGLYNRAVIEDRMNYTIKRIRRDGGIAAVLMLDLNQFKPINDNHGHACGDQLLIQLATRLTDCVRDVDTVARIGGDEFVILLPDIKSPEDAGMVAAKIIQAISRSFEINGNTIMIGISIGISIIPDHGVDSVTLLRHADQAMYHAKRVEKNDYRFYSEAIIDQYIS
jgi:diguanylate cyclase (GGDEF)-like protein/PAS domain S-box-containing protein